MCKLRISAHILQIETGRYNNVNLQDRKCPICRGEQIEDEIHFLLHCSCYTVIRKALFDKLSLHPETYTDKQLLVNLLTTTDKNTLHDLGKYIYTCFRMRQDYIKQTSSHLKT